MLTQYLKPLILAVATLPLLVQPALSHVVWFEYQNGEYELVFGHPESGPEDFDASKFQSATAYDRNKEIVPIEINRQENSLSVVPQGEIAALTAFYDNGYWLRNPGDTSSQNISRQQAEAINYTNVTNFAKSTKALYDWSEPISQSFGLPLEIVPQKNPFEVTAGETLPIKVLYQGNQINNALVEYIGEEVDVDAEGIAYIPVGEEGLLPIEASYTSPTDIAPGISYATTLTAEAVPEPSVMLGLGAFSLLAFAGKSRRQNSSQKKTTVE